MNFFPENKLTILVTGANGQLGSEVRALAINYPFFNFLFTTKESLPVENKNAVNNFFNKTNIDYCVNCAAYTAVDKAEDERETAFVINAAAAGILATACDTHKTKLIHISTDYVYDGSRQQPLKENDTTGPLNVYGLSKLTGEELIIQECPSSIIIRTSWVYSSYGNNFVKTMLRLFKEKESLKVVNDQVGCPTYAANLAAVIMNFIEKDKLGKKSFGIFNYCNSSETTWFDFAIEIKNFTNSACNIIPVASAAYPTKARRPVYSVLDTAKIKETLNLEIPFWKDSLHECLQLLV